MALPSLFIQLDLFGPQAIAPALASAFHATASEIGVTVNATLSGMAVAGIVTGAFGDRISRKPAMVGALLLLSVPTMLAAMAPDVVVFGLLRVVQGILMCGAATMTIAYVAEELGPSGLAPFAMAAFVTGNVGSNLVGRLLVGVAEQYAGWRVAFAALALLNLLGALLVWRLLPPSRNFRAAGGRDWSPRLLWLHLRNPQLQGAFVVGFLTLFAFVGVFTYVNFRLALPPFALAPAERGMIYTVFAAALLATPFAGIAMQRLGHVSALLMGCAAGLVGVLLTRSDSLTVTMAGLALVGIAHFAIQVIATDFNARVAQQAKAAATGILLASIFCGGLCGAFVLGRIYDSWGWNACVNVIAVAYVVTATTGVLVWERHRKIG
jgi:YNFM family putative membrane transporter